MLNTQNISLSGQTAKSDSPAEIKGSMPVNEEVDRKTEQRLNAVVAFLYGESVETVQAEYRVCRSDLYKYRQRALEAMREGLKDKKRGPHHPHNRLTEEKEQSIKAVCERQPTFSSYQVKEKLGEEAPTPRTIQRVRNRLSLPRLKKRTAPSFKAHRFTDSEKQTIQKHVEEKMYLGRYRLAWDLQNKDNLLISPSTTRLVKRAIIDEQNPKPPKPVGRFYARKHPHSLWHGDFMEKVALAHCGKTAYQFTLLDDYSRAYVFCGLSTEPDESVVITGLITAMREYQTIPKALVFDNGSCFRGRVLSSFCRQLRINLIHTSLNHPRTNGKLERAFRDDMNEFYKRYDKWRLWELQENLPEYVHYRNHIRGHWALGGKPSISRLQEQDCYALPCVLDKLETFARSPIGFRVVRNGHICLLGTNVYLWNKYKNGEHVFLTDTLEGLEIRTQDGKVWVLPQYRRYAKASSLGLDVPERIRIHLRNKVAPLTSDEIQFLDESGFPDFIVNRPRIAVAL